MNASDIPAAPTLDLSSRQARQIALSAIGLARPRPSRPGPAALAAMIDRLAMVQIDSVSVLARAHFMPGFSRLGAYDTALLDKASRGTKRRLFEYWGHEASLIDVAHHPDLRWRMARARAGKGIYTGLARFGAEKRPFIDAVLSEIETRGALTSRELALDGKGSGSGGWWGWSDGKHALEWLFWAGLVTTKERRGFERIYDLPERVIPGACAIATPSDDEAQRRLVLAAARALGIATVADLRNYWRIGPGEGAARVAELVEAGALVPARVAGWRQQAFMAAGLPAPKRPSAGALVSPFDPLFWERDRAERLLGFRYRIEIYTPAHKRQHGYYVLPFLWKDRVAAKLDLKAERATGRLLVQAAHLEIADKAGAVVAAVAAEMRLLALWLGLPQIVVAPSGDLGPALADALAGGVP